MYVQEIYLNNQIKVKVFKAIQLNGIINYFYLIFDSITKHAVLVDPTGQSSQIKKEIDRKNLILLGILITHSHDDHTTLAGFFSSTYNIPVYVSYEEAFYYKYSPKNVEIFRDNQHIYIGNIMIYCAVTPGHTFGSSCFFIDNNFFTGDTLFIEGCGLCDGLGASSDYMYHSLKKIESLCNEDTFIFPGHAFEAIPGVNFKYVMENNIYLQFNEPTSFTKFRMRKEQKHKFYYK